MVEGMKEFEIAEKLRSKIRFNRNKIYFLYAPMQAGKSRAMMQIMFMAKQSMTNTLTLVRNMRADQEQLVTRIEEHNNQYDAFGLGQIVEFKTKARPSETISILKRSSTELVSDIPKQHLIALGNAANMEILLGILQKGLCPQRSHGVLMIDEADLIGLDFDSKSTTTTNVEDAIQALRPFFHTVIMVSATPLATVFTNGVNQITDVISLDIPDDYHGVDKLKHIQTKEYERPKGKVTRKYCPSSDIRNLETMMDDLVTQPQGRALVVASKDKADHEDIVKTLWTQYPDVTFVVFNDSKAKILGSWNNPISSDGEFKTIGEALQTMKIANMTNPSEYNHIVIVSGNMAGRGISFVSSDYEWHLTHQYLVFSKRSTMDVVMQSLRICGRYQNSPVLKLFCSQSLWDDIVAMNADFKVIISKIETHGPINEFIELQDDISRKWLARRKEKAINVARVMITDKSYDTLERFHSSPDGNVPIASKYIRVADLDPTLGLLKAIQNCKKAAFAEADRISKKTTSFDHGMVYRFTGSVMDKIVSYLNDPAIKDKFGLTGEFAMDVEPTRLMMLDPNRQYKGFNVDPANRRKNQLLIMAENEQDPYIIVKIRQVATDAGIQNLTSSPYAWYSPEGKIVVSKPAGRHAAVPKVTMAA
jgi:hypothetical protein